jgi:hypothetical protein
VVSFTVRGKIHLFSSANRHQDTGEVRGGQPPPSSPPEFSKNENRIKEVNINKH